MAKGKYEAAKKKPVSAAKDKKKPEKKAPKASGGHGRFWAVLAALAGVALIAAGVLLLPDLLKKPSAPVSTSTETAVETEPPGLSRGELEEKAAEIDTALRSNDLVLTLNQDPAPDELPEDPIVLTLTPAQSGARLDLEKLSADLDAGKGKTGWRSYSVDLRDYLVLNDDAIDALAEQTADEYGADFVQTNVKMITEMAPAEPEETQAPPEEGEEGEEPGESETPDESGESETPDESEEPTEPAEPAMEKAQFLVVTKGITGRSFDAEDLSEAIRDVYRNAALGETAAENFQPTLSYIKQVPDPVDPDALWARYCKNARDAALDEDTFRIIPDSNGFGYRQEDLAEFLETAEEGDEIKLRMRVIPAALTEQALLDSMFDEVIAEAHTPHSLIPARTNNLILACAAINGTIVMPGEVFSFNQTVGERTAAKGYQEAIAYVEGGASRPETGGGVCQVASSIYYAVLQADLETVERGPHMFMVDYVPPGMDAAIYWGQMDYKFRNNSPYPIKIESYVADYQVHIILHGTEWKDYTVEMSYQFLETIPWEVKEVVVPNDGTHYVGEVLVTPYTGYRVATFKTIRDANGDVVSTDRVSTSYYNKRDKQIAVFAPTPVVTDPPAPTPTTPPATDPPAPTPTEPPATEPPAPVPDPEPDPVPDPTPDPEVPDPEP